MKKLSEKDLRIAIIIDDPYPASGGIARSVEAQINELSRLGHQVTLIAPKHQLQKPSVCKTIVAPSLHLPGSPPYTCILFFSQKIVKKIIAEHQFDIIHSQTERGALMLSAKLAKSQGIPHIHTFHANLAGTHKTNSFASLWGSLAYLILIVPLVSLFSQKRLKGKVRIENYDNSESFFARFDWFALATIASRVDNYTTPAAFMKENINKRSDGLTKYGKIIPTSANSSLSQIIRSSQPTNQKKDTLRFLSVARLSKEKRIDVIIEAFIKANIPDSHLDIVGFGDQYSALRNLASEHNNIVFHGQVDDMRHIAQFYVDADVFVLASNGFDTQAITISEAATAGLPIIYCDKRLTVGLTTANSLLANSPEATDIANAMTKLTDTVLRKRLSEGSKKEAEKSSPEHMSTAYIRLYRKLIK